MTIYIRNSEIAKFIECPRSWYVSYYRNLEPDWSERLTPATFDTGNAVHAGLKAYYEGRDFHDGITELELEMTENLHDLADMKAWAKVWQMARLMLEHYVIWVEENGMDVGEKTLLLEERLELPMGTFLDEEVVFYCQPDRIVGAHDRDDLIIVEDWKSVDKVARPFMFESDWQMLNYAMVIRTLWDKMPLGARHRQLVRSMHSGRAKLPQFGQETVSFTEERLEQHWRHIHQVVFDIVGLRHDLDCGLEPTVGCRPVRNPRQCSWKCSVGKSGVCSQMDDAADWEHTLSITYRNREDNILSDKGDD